MDKTGYEAEMERLVGKTERRIRKLRKSMRAPPGGRVWDPEFLDPTFDHIVKLQNIVDDIDTAWQREMDAHYY